MKKLIKKVLTDKKTRNLTALITLVVSLGDVGKPWRG